MLHGQAASITHHHEQHGYGRLSAGTCVEVRNVARGVVVNRAYKLCQRGLLYGSPSYAIHLNGVVITWIMREVAAYDKQVVGGEVWLQGLGHALQFVKVLRTYYDGHYRRHLVQMALQERQLHLKAVLAVVCLGQTAEHAVSTQQVIAHVEVYLHVAKRRGVSTEQVVDRSTVEGCLMARSQQEHPLIFSCRINAHICLCRHSSRKT